MTRPALLLALFAACAAGCGLGRRIAGTVTRPVGRAGATLFGGASLTPLEPRIDAAPGTVLVMPVRLAEGVDPRAGVRVRLDDGRPVTAGLYRIGIDPPRTLGSAGRWLEHPGLWSAARAEDEPPPSALAMWALVVDLPADAAGQGLWAGSADGPRQRIAVNWIARPDPAQHAAIPPGPVEAQGSTYLRWLLEPERAGPLRRWRSRMALEALGEAPPPEPAEDAFTDPVIEAMAIQAERRWRCALDRLARADEALARAVAGTLTRVALIDGVWAPAWPVDQTELDTLLLDLLNPRLEDRAVADRIRMWLAALPPAAAVVLDDSALEQAGGRRAVVCVTNLAPEPRLCFAGPTPQSLDPVPVGPRRSARISAALPAPAPQSWPPLTRGPAIHVGAGAWRSVTDALRPVPAEPPGARLTAFASDWTISTWQSGAAATPPPGWETGALIHRTDAATAGEGAGRPEWAAWVECRVAPGTDLSREVVRVWVGPFGRPWAVLRVTPDGQATDERARSRGEPEAAPRVSVARADDRWSFQVSLPRGAADLPIAVERLDATGRRWTWPRPMLPWQDEPGRGIIDTGAWRTLSEGD